MMDRVRLSQIVQSVPICNVCSTLTSYVNACYLAAACIRICRVRQQGDKHASEAAEMEAIFREVYYSGTDEEYN